MRIIGTIDHPVLKITIFKMDNRISVKFENDSYEQTYKLGMDERFSDPEAIKRWVSPDFLEAIQQIMAQMHKSRLEATSRAFPADTAAEFETII